MGFFDRYILSMCFNCHKHLLATLVGALLAPIVFAEQPLFANDEPMNAVLTAPLTQAYAQKRKEVRLWLPGQWAYSEADGNTVRVDVAVKTRGIFRRRNCRLPPLRLNFKRKQVQGTLMEGQDKLKLVSPCERSRTSQQHIVLEYLAYRSLQILTEHSLRSRLIRLSYIDSDKRNRSWTHLVFVIETEEALAARTGMVAKHLPAIAPNQLDQEKTALIDMFQLMIGNNDFSTVRGPGGADCCHNVEIIGPPESQKNFIPIPYDFDASGLVNTGYAAPPEGIPIKSVRTRYFKGRCKSPELWQKTIAHFQTHRAELFDLFENSTELSGRYKAKTLSYMKKFYNILDDPKRVNKEIIGRCYGSQPIER